MFFFSTKFSEVSFNQIPIPVKRHLFVTLLSAKCCLPGNKVLVYFPVDKGTPLSQKKKLEQNMGAHTRQTQRLFTAEIHE